MIRKNLRKESTNSSLKGFTLMELIVGIIIASIATLAILYSVLYVQTSSYDLRVRERAYEELKSFTELWKAKISVCDIPSTNTYSKSVCLEGDFGNCGDDCDLCANLTSNIKRIDTGTSLSRRDGLRTEIVWSSRNGSDQKIEFYLEQLQIPEACSQ